MWVLVDVSYLMYRGAFSLGDLSFKEYETTLVYSFFEQLRTICSDPRVGTSRIALCFDSRYSYRKEEFPSYKAKRKVGDKDTIERKKIVHRQVRFLYTKVLPDIGFRCYRQRGLESDDMLAIAAKNFFGVDSGKQAVIITADNDLFQCISEQVHWFDPGRNKYYDPFTFFKRYEIYPDIWYYVKEMVGCSTDCVPGIPGIGEKTAILCLNGFLKKGTKKFKRIHSREARQIIIRNRALVTLPHMKAKHFELKEPEYNVDAFWKWMERLGFKSYQTESSRRFWNRFFTDLDFGIRTQLVVRGRKSQDG